MLLTQKEQEDIVHLCENTMEFSSQAMSSGVIGSLGSGASTQLLALRRAIAHLDNSKKSNSKATLHKAFDAFEAALQSYVSLSGSMTVAAAQGRVTPEEIESILERIDEIRARLKLG